MKKLQNGKSVLYRYLTSYFIVILLCCSVIGLFLFNSSVSELRRTMNRETQNKLTLAAADLENQQSVMNGMALGVATTIFYKPFYRERNKYYETELLEDFAKYSGRSPLADDYFLLYHGDPWIFTGTAKNTFAVYADSVLGLTDSAALYDRLNAADTFAVILPEDGESNWLIFVYPVNIAPGCSASLCFVTHISTIRNRIRDAAGSLSGTISIRCGSQVIEFPVGNSSDTAGKDEILTAVSPENMFTVSLTQSGSAYQDLDYFLRFNLILVILFALLFLGLSVFLAYSNYRPIRELASKYHIPESAAKENKDEIRRIDEMLGSALEKQRLSQTQLHEQYLQLKNQQLLLILSGGYGKNIRSRSALPDFPFPGPFYFAMAIRVQETPREGMEVLCGQLEELSGEGFTFYTVKLYQEEECYAVLASFDEDGRRDEAAELVSAVLDASEAKYTLGAGPAYQDINLMPASLFDALSSCEKTLPAEPAREALSGASDGKWYDDGPALRMIAAIKSGNAGEAEEQLEAFAQVMEQSAPSMLMRCCIFSDVLNSLIRASYEMRIPVSPEHISTLMNLKDLSSFREGVSSLITELCGQMQAETEHRSREKLQEILGYIEEHALEYDLSQEKVAEHFNITSNHLYHLIKDGTGMKYKDYITNLRIGSAKIFLTEKKLSVTETCQRIGYTNIPHFIKTFKRITGYTPTAYRDSQNTK